ncbi:DUF4220 domain-containing protein [Citrus sinensis]|uniref:DUF4220 domain-containing protein n=1 Tax=Citrus sinensis TaxID=2711 RepID=A0ACB8JXK2_CITSI|nr:DUF4220 domain-containing protein [Citrus sinensis]
MQTILILLGPLRNRTSNTLITILIWSAYLLADWSPKFGVGLITESKRSAGGGDGGGSGSVNNQFVALWAQFLLLHLGGSDTITAFSLEDNQLWIRQMFGVAVQAVAAGYIFFQTLPGGNQLVIPVVFVFIAGVIKCFERIRAAYLASEKVVRKQISEELPDSETLEKEVTRIQSKGGSGSASKNKESVELARLYSKLFLGIIFDLIIHFDFNLERFITQDPSIALKNIEVELNFIYELFHTKINFVLSGLGMILRFTSFSSVVVALSVFYTQANSSNDAFEVGVTYTLFWATIALELLSIGFILHSRVEKTKQVSLKTRPLLWRRWSLSISGFSWITYLAKARPLQRLARSDGSEASASEIIFARIIALNDAVNQVLPIGMVHRTLHDLVHRYAPQGTENWLHNLLKEHLPPIDPKLEESAAKTAAKREINSSRGDWILREWERRHHLRHEAVEKIKKPTQSPPTQPRYRFDQDVLIWHAATELLYCTDDHRDRDPDREFSKLLSDYMLYLLVSKPEMLNTVDNVAKSELKESVPEARSSKLSLKPSELKTVCESILNGRSSNVISAKQFYFSHGINLANELKGLDDQKWKLIREVWIEMLAYGATHSRPRTHAQQLCNGGELITFVWLLVLHFGLVDNKPQD